MKTPTYLIQPVTKLPELKGLWSGSAWDSVQALGIAIFRPEGSTHKPRTRCKLQYDTQGLYGIFQVEDRYMRCVHTDFQSDVYKDSCVEIFLEPKPGQGYFNFEFNCLGVLKASFITDPQRIDGQIQGEDLNREDDALIERFHSIKEIPDLEINDPVTWYLEFFIPFKILRKYTDSSIELQEWHGNLFKCGDETSHPHWASWSAVPELNFHFPENFGKLIFLDR